MNFLNEAPILLIKQGFFSFSSSSDLTSVSSLAVSGSSVVSSSFLPSSSLTAAEVEGVSSMVVSLETTAGGSVVSVVDLGTDISSSLISVVFVSIFGSEVESSRGF